MKTVVHSIALAVLLVLGVGGWPFGVTRGAEDDANPAADATAGIKVVPAALKRAGDPFDLVFAKGQQARYVRFKIHANYGNDEYGSFVGLNEVRFLSSDKPLLGSIKATASSAFRADQTPTKRSMAAACPTPRRAPTTGTCGPLPTTTWPMRGFNLTWVRTANSTPLGFGITTRYGTITT